MTDGNDARPTRQALAVEGRSARLRVTGRLRTALEAMAWQGARRAEAAVAAGLTDHGLRAALRKPHVKAFYLGELDVLRTSEKARSIHALVDIRDASENAMAKVQAIKALEALEDNQPVAAGRAERPGLVIIVRSGGDREQHTTISVGSNVGTAGPVSQDQHLQPHVGPPAGTTFRRAPSLPAPEPETIDLRPVRSDPGPRPAAQTQQGAPVTRGRRRR